MTSPLKVKYRLSDLHLHLFGTAYLISLDGSLFFKASSAQELRTYYQLNLSHSPLLSFMPRLVGIYRCEEDTLNLLVDMSGDLSKIDFEAIEPLLISTTKCRTSNCHGAIFTALKNLNYHSSTDATDLGAYFVDLKLGFLTFPLGAQQSKIISQEKKAMDTTTASHGVRLMGAVLPAGNKDLARRPVLVTKMDGRLCSYDNVLGHIHSFIPHKSSLDQLVTRLNALSSSLQKECLHMCGPSILICNSPQDYTDNHMQRSLSLRVFLVDFAHTYTPEQAATLCADEHTLSMTTSATIATCIDNLSHNLQLHRNPQDCSSSYS